MALTGRTGLRICDMMGLETDPDSHERAFPPLYWLLFDRCNMNRDYEFPFPREKCRVVAAALAEEILPRYKLTVLLGRLVQRCFFRRVIRNKGPRLFHQRGRDYVAGCEVVVAAHPSGRNYWWNEPENVLEARAFWPDVLRLAKETVR